MVMMMMMMKIMITKTNVNLKRAVEGFILFSSNIRFLSVDFQSLVFAVQVS